MSQPDANIAPVFNLPPQSTPFVGRENELADVIRRLTDRDCRLLTLVGSGGIGKTRLALQVAHAFVGSNVAENIFNQGILFVPLNAVNSASGLVSAVAEAANFTFYSSVPPQQQLLNFLRPKNMLLILDNLEELLDDGAGLIAEILAAAPAVKILVTSRQALNMHEAWYHPIQGLSFPPYADEVSEPKRVTSLDRYDAIKLFVQSAGRARVDFSLPAEQAHVVKICQLVEGMPLAIELAAAWLRILSSREIVQEIKRSLDVLSSRLRNTPERHRSIRAVFEHTWQLLMDEELETLMRLSVFRSSFDQPAATFVAQSSLPSLATLVEKSLLSLTNTGRYHMHELLRQFAGEKLAESWQEDAPAHERHSDYYLEFLEARQQKLVGQGLQQTLNEIGREIDNIRRAWDWAIAQHNLEAIEQTLDGFYNFFQIRSRYQEGAEIFSHTAVQLQRVDGLENNPLFYATLHRLLARQGAFTYFLGNYETAGQLLEKNLNTIRGANGQAQEEAFVLNLLGQIAGWQGNESDAKAYLNQSLAICRKVGNLNGAANALHKLAQISGSFGHYTEGKKLAGESLSLSRKLGRSDWRAYALDVLGWTTICLGEYAESETYYQEGLAIFQDIGDQLGLALALGGLGSVGWAMGGDRLSQALDYFEKSLVICRDIGHRHHTASRLWYLAQITNDLGDYAQAQDYAQEGLTVAREVGSPVFATYNLCALGEATCELGDLQASRQYLLEALKIASQVRQLPTLTIALYHFAVLLMKESALAEAGEPKNARAFELLTFILRHPATWHPFKERAASLLTQLGTVLSKAQMAASRARVQDHSSEEVAAEILNRETATARLLEAQEAMSAPEVVTGTRTRLVDQPLVEPLTPRELEVLQLISQGLTNPQIADQLIISVGTVKYYTAQIYGKLEVHTRTQAVARARELGLLSL